jgi:putative spermidine/putrescine transport system permease protein
MRTIFMSAVLIIYGFIFLPLVVVVLISFNDGSVASFPIETWSLRWYGQALETKSYIESLITSTWLAIAATLIATPLALAAAFAIARGNVPGRAAIEAYLMSPVLVPGIVIGIALLMACSALQFRDAPLRLLFAHVLIALPYCTRTILASLSRMEPSLIESARTLGADPWRAFFHVTLPLARPGIVAGMIFAFLQSFGDVPISMFLIDARNSTLPLAIMAHLEHNANPGVAAISSLVTIGSLALALTLERLVGLKSAFG